MVSGPLATGVTSMVSGPLAIANAVRRIIALAVTLAATLSLTLLLSNEPKLLLDDAHDATCA